MSHRNFFLSLRGLLRLAFAFASALATGLMLAVPAWAQMPTPARSADSHPKPSEPASLPAWTACPVFLPGRALGCKGPTARFHRCLRATMWWPGRS